MELSKQGQKVEELEVMFVRNLRGEVLIGENEVVARWQEYCGQLLSADVMNEYEDTDRR